MSSPYHDFDVVHVVDDKELVRPARLRPNYTSEEMVTWLRAVHEYNSAVAAAHAKAFAEVFRERLARGGGHELGRGKARTRARAAKGRRKAHEAEAKERDDVPAVRRALRGG